MFGKLSYGPWCSADIIDLHENVVIVSINRYDVCQSPKHDIYTDIRY